jgi:hypothetical protein
MTQGVKDLIAAIAAGDSVAIDAAWNAEMATRISEKLDDMRVSTAKGMFQTEAKKKKDAECDESIGDVAQGAVNVVKKIAGVATGAVGGVTGALDGLVKGSRKGYHAVADSYEPEFEEQIVEEQDAEGINQAVNKLAK